MELAAVSWYETLNKTGSYMIRHYNRCGSSVKHYRKQPIDNDYLGDIFPIQLYAVFHFKAELFYVALPFCQLQYISRITREDDCVKLFFESGETISFISKPEHAASIVIAFRSELYNIKSSTVILTSFYAPHVAVSWYKRSIDNDTYDFCIHDYRGTTTRPHKEVTDDMVVSILPRAVITFVTLQESAVQVAIYSYLIPIITHISYLDGIFQFVSLCFGENRIFMKLANDETSRLAAMAELAHAINALRNDPSSELVKIDDTLFVSLREVALIYRDLVTNIYVLKVKYDIRTIIPSSDSVWQRFERHPNFECYTLGNRVQVCQNRTHSNILAMLDDLSFRLEPYVDDSYMQLAEDVQSLIERE